MKSAVDDCIKLREPSEEKLEEGQLLFQAATNLQKQVEDFGHEIQNYDQRRNKNLSEDEC